MLETLQKLISIPSYSNQEQEIQLHIKSQLESSGINPFLQDNNLIVHLHGADQTRAFIFNGHVDVVNIGELSDWEYNPWEGKIVKGRIYGRGTSDMKSGIWAMIETAKSFSEKSALPTDIWFAFVVREETDGEGSKQLADWFKKEGYLNRYREIAAVFPEPTNMTAVQYGHRGNFFIKAEKIGVAGHSSRPSAINPHAILEMAGFINDLTEEGLRWHEKFIGSEFTPPSVTPTSIEATSASPNKTSTLCQAVFDLRTIPGFHEEALNRIRSLAARRDIKLSLLYPPAPTAYTNPDAKIVRAFQQVLPNIRTEVNDASNDLGFFSELGIDGVMFGPGEMSEAHRTNESADIGQIISAPGLFEKIYMTWAK